METLYLVVMEDYRKDPLRNNQIRNIETIRMRVVRSAKTDM